MLYTSVYRAYFLIIYKLLYVNQYYSKLFKFEGHKFIRLTLLLSLVTFLRKCSCHHHDLTLQ